MADWQIVAMADQADMISPFSRQQVRQIGGLDVISFGVSSFGYDLRLSPEFKELQPTVDILDPKAPNPDDWASSILPPNEPLIIPAHGFVLGRSVEYFKIPEDVLVLCIGKSTYARYGLIVNVTPLEPGWEGHITIELSNTATVPVKVYAHEGIAQAVFFKAGAMPTVSYADRKGKYQKQLGVTIGRL